jgi:hypothetical protein
MLVLGSEVVWDRVIVEGRGDLGFDPLSFKPTDPETWEKVQVRVRARFSSRLAVLPVAITLTFNSNPIPNPYPYPLSFVS